MVTIISVGKGHDSVFRTAIAHYEKRLSTYTKFAWVLVKPSGLDGNDARKEESKKIISKLSADDFVLLLDEKGETLTSPNVAAIIDNCQNTSRNLVVVIGGAYGVDESIHTRANRSMAFGKAVFPHQLMRVMTLEQLYRAHSILAGSPYHHL